MFTGLVEDVGQLSRFDTLQNDLRLWVDAPGLGLDHVNIGDSIAVNGVCLTVVLLDLSKNKFAADASRETINCTSLGQLQIGTLLNLEKALTLSKPLGGHLVSGHVDGLAQLLHFEKDARSIRYTFEVPTALARYIAAKGSVCLDGISLTVNFVQGVKFEVNLIPHTQQATNAHLWTPGQKVNLEVDLIARYLDRFMQVKLDETSTQGSVTIKSLIDNGFA